MSRLDLLRHPLASWLTAKRAVTASVASMSAVMLIAATPGSPYHPVLPESQANGPLELLSKAVLLDRLPHGLLIAIGFVAMIAAGVSFLLILWAAERGLVSTKTVLTLTVAYHLAILLLPLLLSRDVFSYAYYGRILSRYGGNPYVNTPADYPANDLWRFTWPGWRETPSVYGPVFVWLAAAITAIFRSIPDVIMAFRAVAVAASLGAVWFVVKLVQRVKPSKTAYAAAMIGLNPVVLFHTVGGGHVDVLVMLSVAAAIYLVATDRELPATVALTVGALVKISAAVPLVLLIAYVATRAEPGKRARVLVTHIGTAVGIFLVAALPFLQRSNPTLGMVELVQHGSWIAPPALVERIFEALGELLAGEVGRIDRRRHRAVGHVRGPGGRTLPGAAAGRASRVRGFGLVPGGGLGLGLPVDDAVLPHAVPLVLRVGAAGGVGVAVGAAPHAGTVVPGVGDGLAHHRELPAPRVDARGPRDRAPGARHRAGVVPARPVAAVEVRRAAGRRDRRARELHRERRELAGSRGA